MTIIQSVPTACPRPPVCAPTITPPAKTTQPSRRKPAPVSKQPYMITHQFPNTGWQTMIDSVAKQYGTTTEEILGIKSNQKVLQKQISDGGTTDFVLIIPSRRP
jgi:hypothetical protein